jgi:hypothetical protein
MADKARPTRLVADYASALSLRARRRLPRTAAGAGEN